MNALSSLAKSFRYAAAGIAKVAREERNFRLQIWAAVLVFVLMIWFRLAIWEVTTLTLAIALVLVLELLNSVLERVVDILKPRIHHYVEDVKDMMAGAVLVASVAAAFVGFLVFWPHVRLLL